MRAREQARRAAPQGADAGARATVRRCACHGARDRGLPTRLQVGPRDDAFEQQADRAAEAILAGRRAPATAAAPHAPQRKCAACEAEDEEAIRRSSTNGAAGAAGGARADVAARAVASGGRPLGPALREYFEPRFGADLSGVRLHTDGRAADAADGLQAHAFTLGSDIAFARGAFAPESSAGRRLLAHELTHVVQQARGAAPAIRRNGREGTTEFEEDVLTPPPLAGGVYRGRVRRRVFAPASDTQPREMVHEASARVEFDAANCSVRLPHTFRFVAGEAGAADICNEPARPAAVSAVDPARVTEIGRQYVEAINTGLQNWYTVRLEGDGCGSACKDQDMPIRVDATAPASGAADTTITVSPRAGRADAATICAPDFNAGTNVHEGGHQVLGAGDEYRERDAAVLARAPQWGRVERVRTDWSRMGSHHAYGRFALFHERHFAHVPAFLQSIYPGCQARLVEVSRPALPDFRFSIGGGYASLGGVHGGYADLGLEMGIPLDRLREWEFVVGPHGRFIGNAGPTEQQAFLVGARMGLERRVNPAVGGFRIGAFGEAGAGAFRRESPSGSYEPEPYTAAPYGELGLGAGYRFGPGSTTFDVNLEAATGTTFTDLPEAGTGLSGDRLQWLRIGLTVGGEF
jgi:hypothetical protein